MTETTQLTPLQQIGKNLKQQENRLLALLPQSCTPQRFIQIVGNALIKNPYLLTLDKTSLMDSCLKCAEDGLLPDGREAALVPMGGKVQYMPMVAGVLKKMRNSRELLSIKAEIVYKGDDFDYCLGDDDKLIHKPNLEVEPTLENVLFVYSVAKTKNGGIYRSLMTKNQINAIRDKSQAYISFLKGKTKSSIWNSHWEEMAKKTVIHRVAKLLPSNTDIVNILNSEDMQVSETTLPEKKNIFDAFKTDVIDTTSNEVLNEEDFEISPEIIAQAEALEKERGVSK